MRDTDDGAEIISTQDLDPDSLQRVIEMRQVAFESWWAPEHPGWGIIDEAPPDGKVLPSSTKYQIHALYTSRCLKASSQSRLDFADRRTKDRQRQVTMNHCVFHVVGGFHLRLVLLN